MGRIEGIKKGLEEADRGGSEEEVRRVARSGQMGGSQAHPAFRTSLEARRGKAEAECFGVIRLPPPSSS